MDMHAPARLTTPVPPEYLPAGGLYSGRRWSLREIANLVD
jgi:hypothetical protein